MFFGQRFSSLVPCNKAFWFRSSRKLSSMPMSSPAHGIFCWRSVPWCFLGGGVLLIWVVLAYWYRGEFESIYAAPAKLELGGDSRRTSI